MTLRSLLTMSIVLVGLSACTPVTPPAAQCHVDDDCALSTGLCDRGLCVQCIGDDNCSNGETCVRNLCVSSSGEGEGEGDIGEGEGEGEGDSGEGEGEVVTPNTACGPFTCDPGTTCLTLDNDVVPYCFAPCGNLNTNCTTTWGFAGKCRSVEGQHVCVSTAPDMGLCGSVGNARCATDFTCVSNSATLSQCVHSCNLANGDADCSPSQFCAQDGAETFCYEYRENHRQCGLFASQEFYFCDMGLACEFLPNLNTGRCGVDNNGDGTVDGTTPNPGDGNVVHGGNGGGEGEGEGEAPPPKVRPHCQDIHDCLIASFGSPSENCQSDLDCNSNDPTNHTSACTVTALGDHYCVLRNSSDPSCEQLPNNPRLTTTTGTDIDGSALGYCAMVGTNFCNAQGTCEGTSWP